MSDVASIFPKLAVSLGGVDVVTVNFLFAVFSVSPCMVAVTVIFSLPIVSAPAITNVTLAVPVDVAVFPTELSEDLKPVPSFKFCSVMFQLIAFPLKLSPIGANVNSLPCCTEKGVEAVLLFT